MGSCMPPTTYSRSWPMLCTPFAPTWVASVGSDTLMVHMGCSHGSDDTSTDPVTRTLHASTAADRAATRRPLPLVEATAFIRVLHACGWHTFGLMPLEATTGLIFLPRRVAIVLAGISMHLIKQGTC